jgi:hypothetical protein
MLVATATSRTTRNNASETTSTATITAITTTTTTTACRAARQQVQYSHIAAMENLAIIYSGFRSLGSIITWLFVLFKLFCTCQLVVLNSNNEPSEGNLP